MKNLPIIALLILISSPLLGNQQERLLLGMRHQGEKWIIQALLDGADLEIPDKRGATPLLEAISSGFLKSVEILLRSGADPTKIDVEGRTALHLAAEQGDPEIVSMLAGLNLSINARENMGQSTPAMLAAARGRFGALRVLVQKGANLELKDCSQWTALHHALTQNKAVSIKNKVNAALVLLEGGANPNTPTAKKKTPIHMAAELGNWVLVNKLIQRGANVHAQDLLKRTPYQLCFANPDVRAAATLLVNGAAANWKQAPGILGKIILMRECDAERAREYVYDALMRSVTSDNFVMLLVDSVANLSFEMPG